MDKQTVTQVIEECHMSGQKAAVSFCSHVPEEILEAAGFCSIRLLHTEDVEDISTQALPKNLCPVVKRCYSICEDGTLAEADLILAESSCDGKKKMYELLTRQEQLYYYQVPQGEDREYVLPLIRSECRYLMAMIEKRFGVKVTEEELRAACHRINQERQSVMSLLEIQMQMPPAAYGYEILQILEKNRAIADRAARTEANVAARNAFLSRKSPVPSDAKRVLVTGCPISGVYHKVVNAIEQNGGVAVCFENCEAVKSCRRRVDTDSADLIGAIAACYQNTACAIMAPNPLRFALIDELVEQYHVDGIIDLTLQTCHSYSVERDKMRRFCIDREIPYIPVETDFSDADMGQITTRISAFIEIL